jgi:O-antigen ligase
MKKAARRRCKVAAATAFALMLALAAVLAEPAHSVTALEMAVQPLGNPLPPPPPAASTPNQALIDFLQHPVGVVVGGIATLGSGVAMTWALLSHWRHPAETGMRRRERGRREHRRADGDGTAVRNRGTATALLGATLAAGVFLLPLVFSIAFDDVFAMPKSWLLWLLAGITLVLMVAAALRGERPVRIGFVELFAGAFLLFNLGATVVAEDQAHAVIGERLQYQGLLSTAAYVVLFLAARHAFAASQHVRALSWALLASAVVAAGYGLAQWVGLDPLWSQLFKGRIFSTMGQANWLAALLATALVMTIPLAGGRSMLARLSLAVAAVGIVLALFLTFGRGGYLGLVAGAVLAGAVLLRGLARTSVRRLAPRAAVGVTATVLVIIALAALWQPAGDLAGRVTERVAVIADPNESSNRIRLDLWAVAAAVTSDHPLTGTGPDSYVLVFPDYRDVVLAPDRAANLAKFRPESPHNVYLAVASGAGLPALAALVALIGSAFWLGARAAWGPLDRENRLALAGLLGGSLVITLTNGFMTGDPATSAIWFVVLGATISLSSTILSPAPPVTRQTEEDASQPRASRRRGRRRG